MRVKLIVLAVACVAVGAPTGRDANADPTRRARRRRPAARPRRDGGRRPAPATRRRGARRYPRDLATDCCKRASALRRAAEPPRSDLATVCCKGRKGPATGALV